MVILLHLYLSSLQCLHFIFLIIHTRYLNSLQYHRDLLHLLHFFIDLLLCFKVNLFFFNKNLRYCQFSLYYLPRLLVFNMLVCMILFLTSITFSLFHEYLILAIHSLILNFSTNLLYLTLLSSQSLIILSTLLTFVLIFYSISLPHPSFAKMLQCLLSIVYRFIIIIFEQLYFYIILSILICLFF